MCHVPAARARRITAIVAVLLLATVSAAPAAATYPGVNGRIAYMAFDEQGQFQIWTANPDLTHRVQLTDVSPGSSWPSWSPDGTRIAFQSGRTDPDPTDDQEVQDIFTMRADGTDLRQVTDSLGDSEKPAWSPDGRWLVFAADRADYPRSQGIYIVPSDGSAPPRRVTTLPTGSIWQELARYSPDGTRIVFTEYRGGKELPNRQAGRTVAQQSALFTIRLDGTELRQVTPWGIAAGDADWSPDGARLVFGAQPTHQGNIGDIHVADADGGHLKDLTQDHGFTGPGRLSSVWYEESINPAWSPDGTQIIFLHFSFTEADGFEAGLQVMSPDGSNRRYLGSERVEGHQPDWGTAPLVP